MLLEINKKKKAKNEQRTWKFFTEEGNMQDSLHM